VEGGDVEAVAAESRRAVTRSRLWRQVFLPGLLRPLLGDLLAGAPSCLLPWDGVREDDRWEREEERRENHQIWGVESCSCKMQNRLQQLLELLQCASVAHFVDAAPFAHTTGDGLSIPIYSLEILKKIFMIIESDKINEITLNFEIQSFNLNLNQMNHYEGKCLQIW
jgi:hypothetical protein